MPSINELIEPIALDIRVIEASLAPADDRGQSVPASGTTIASLAKVEQDPSREIQAQQDPRHPET